jgi:hypothetical protein
MTKNQIDEVVNTICSGKRCYCSFEDDDFSTTISIEQNGDHGFSYQYSIRHKYDVVSPTQYDNRIVDESEVRSLLATLPRDSFDRISYVDTNSIHEKNRRKAELIFSYLKHKPRTVYVVFKEDRWEKSQGENHSMHLSGLYRSTEQAENSVEYLRAKQGARAEWKQVLLTLAGEELEMDTDQLEAFFQD